MVPWMTVQGVKRLASLMYEELTAGRLFEHEGLVIPVGSGLPVLQ